MNTYMLMAVISINCFLLEKRTPKSFTIANFGHPAGFYITEANSHDYLITEKNGMSTSWTSPQLAQLDYLLFGETAY